MGAPPPRRRGWPWWAWLLCGCGGCLALGVIGSMVIGFSFMQRMNAIGPVTPQALQQKLGDIPLYPNGTLDETATRAAYAGAGFATGLLRGKGEISAVASMRTNDSEEQITRFYDRAMAQNHWAQLQSGQQPFVTQHQYRRGNDLAMVQIQKQPGGRVITLMRMKIQGAAGGAPSPTPGSPNLQPAQ